MQVIKVHQQSDEAVSILLGSGLSSGGIPAVSGAGGSIAGALEWIKAEEWMMDGAGLKVHTEPFSLVTNWARD